MLPRWPPPEAANASAFLHLDLGGRGQGCCGSEGLLVGERWVLRQRSRNRQDQSEIGGSAAKDGLEDVGLDAVLPHHDDVLLRIHGDVGTERAPAGKG